MSDAETQHVVELQGRLTQRFKDLGFAGNPHAAILAHDLAEVLARSRSLEQQMLPLFFALDPAQRRSLAEVTLGIKNQLDAVHDSILDMQNSLQALADFLLRAA